MKKFLMILILYSSLFILNCFAQSGWQIIPSGTSTSLQSIHFADYDTGYVVGEAGTVLKSTDSGLTWQYIQTPVTNDLNDLFVFDGHTVVAVGDSGTIIFTIDGGNVWFLAPYVLTEDYYSVSFSGDNGICGGSSQTILYGVYGGTEITWYEVQSGFFGGGFFGAYMLSPQIGFVAGENSIFQPLLGRTTDSGVNWDFTAFYLNNNEGKATGVDFTDLNNGYVSAAVWDGTGAVSKTSDGGVNWITMMNNNPLWDIDFPISATGLVGYAVGESGTILKTYNGGFSWPAQQSGTQQRLNGVYFLDLDFGFAVGDGGIILRTTEGGVPVELTSFSAIVNERDIILNWTTATETNNRGFEIEKLFGDSWAVIGFMEGNGTTTEPKSYSFRDEDLEAGIYNYRLKQIDYDGTFEYSEIVEAVITTPGKFELSQNYPNPFNPSTKIKFTIPVDAIREKQEVVLKVYDVLGNEVATLVKEELPAGEYAVEFKPESSIKNPPAGRQGPASGIYFYQLKAGDYIQSRKMILLK